MYQVNRLRMLLIVQVMLQTTTCIHGLSHNTSVLYFNRKIMTQVTDFFRARHRPGISPSFRDFNPASGKDLQNMMFKLVKASIEAESSVSLKTCPATQSSASSDAAAVMAAVTEAKTAVENNANPRLVKMALGIFLTHSKEAQSLGVVVPSLKDHYEFAGNPIKEAIPRTNPTTAGNLKGMQTLAYWREDYGINEHHYNWHLVYPWQGIPVVSKPAKVQRTIDRQGELFFYMHTQMLARYDAERLSWNIELTDPWSYDELVGPGYTPPPALRDLHGARPPLRGWHEGQTPYIPKGQAPPTKDTLIRNRNNINKAIIDGFFYTKKGNGKQGKFYFKDDPMNWVGIVVEAEAHQLLEVRPGSNEFIDESLYGSLHNLGHEKFSEIGYQTYGSGKNRWGIMGSVPNAARDPVFWIWHLHVDGFRQSVVKKYKQHPLKESAPPHVRLTEVQILPQDEHSATPDGGITTYLTAPELDKHEVNAKLDHEPYKLVVKVETIGDIEKFKPFTVRIFIVPKLLMGDQRHYIEMDKFSYTLTKKTATITRLDVQSSVARKQSDPSKLQGPRSLCGWPQNMMLPSGTEQGMDYVIFAMLTDDSLSEDDRNVSISLCGVKDGKYPDIRGMGYPFDRAWFTTSSEMQEAIMDLRHVKLSEFKIYRETKIYQGRKVPPNGDISWENTIKNLFTDSDKKYMSGKYSIKLAEKSDVIQYRIFILGLFENGAARDQYGSLPHWPHDKLAKFEAWMDADFP